jgi:hypothetical protein
MRRKTSLLVASKTLQKRLNDRHPIDVTNSNI